MRETLITPAIIAGEFERLMRNRFGGQRDWNAHCDRVKVVYPEVSQGMEFRVVAHGTSARFYIGSAADLTLSLDDFSDRYLVPLVDSLPEKP